MSCGASVIRLERYRYERSVIHACIHYCTRVYTRVYTRVHYPEHTECLVGLSVSGRVGKSLGALVLGVYSLWDSEVHGRQVS